MNAKGAAARVGRRGVSCGHLVPQAAARTPPPHHEARKGSAGVGRWRHGGLARTLGDFSSVSFRFPGGKGKGKGEDEGSVRDGVGATAFQKTFWGSVALLFFPFSSLPRWGQ